MLTRQDILKAIGEFVESANKNNLFIEKILLFGSYAKGKPHEYSDIDLAVFSKQFTDNPFENIKLIQGTTRLPQMQLHLYPLKEFEEDPFVNEIKKHSIEIPLKQEKLILKKLLKLLLAFSYLCTSSKRIGTHFLHTVFPR